MAQHSIWGIILASSKGEQLSQDADTAFLSLGSRPVIAHAIQAFEDCPDIDAIALIVPKEKVDVARGLLHMLSFSKVKNIIIGTTQRQTSLMNALKALEDEATIMVIHEASRPFVSADQISTTIRSAKRHGSGVTALKASGAYRYADKGKKTTKSLDGGVLWDVQSPQAYRTEFLAKALEAASKSKKTGIDESGAFDLIRKEVKLVPSQDRDFKIDTPSDLVVASALLH